MISLLLLVTTFLTFLQANDDAGPPTLKLETDVVGGKFCTGDDEVDTYLMRLRLRYTNTSRVPIVLYKGSSVVTTIIVSKSMEAAAANQHELNQPLTIFQMIARPLSEKTILDNRFAVLRKGASFDTFVEVAVPFRKKDYALAGTVAAGEHFLQLRVSTWPASSDLAQTLRKSWRRRGHLWSEVTESAPMRFQIDKQVKSINCNNSLEYRVWRVFPEDRRGFTVIVVSVDSRHFNRPDMTVLAGRLKQEFPGKARLKVGLLDDPDTARLFVAGRVNYATYERAERGRYYLDRTKCREYIQFSMRRGRPRKTIPIKCSISQVSI